jgi:hypothetical protein
MVVPDGFARFRKEHFVRLPLAIGPDGDAIVGIKPESLISPAWASPLGTGSAVITPSEWRNAR